MYEMKLDFFTTNHKFPFFIQYGHHSGDFFMHTHKDFTELVIVMEGSAIHVVEEESYEIKKGDIFVIGSNTAHGFRNSKEFRLCNIMFHPELMFPEESDIKRSRGFHALFVLEPYITKEYEFQSKLRMNFEEYQKVSHMIEEMMMEYRLRKEGWQEMLKSCFLHLIIYLSRIYKLPEKTDHHDLIYIANAVSYIENHYTETLTVQQLAQIAYLSERHFSRIFQNTYQISPMQYVIKLRLHHASLLLKNTELPITEIATQSGFTDNNYFARIFKRYYHCTPSSFRSL
ncbi:AraC family transcriptional regulator [Anaerosporobacter faecicola]|uniref:AraC family transcriptional regulator n=1 Tax=Anaerosporobacter faecicola TaxID=2718714 RepID=UPI00143BBBBC|nr:AraC family transcriptional regulator [Anaerosporobacter faecicola]